MAGLKHTTSLWVAPRDTSGKWVSSRSALVKANLTKMPIKPMPRAELSAALDKLTGEK